MVGVGFTWNLFDGGQTRNRAAALHSASRALNHRLEDLGSTIELEVRLPCRDVHEARVRVKASSEAAAQSQQNLRITRELYGAGLGANALVLDADTLQINAFNDHDNAAVHESLSLLRLERAVGAR